MLVQQTAIERPKSGCYSFEMFRNPHFERIRQTFFDQFEPDGTSFLYRKNSKGAPIRVTEDERDSFVASFSRRLRYVTWSIVPTTFLLIGTLAFLAPDIDSTSGQLAMWAGLGLVLGPGLLIMYWAWNAPARELERRPAESLPRTREELKQIKFAKITYRQLAFMPVASALLLWKVSAKNDVLHGWGMLWLVFAGVLIAIAGVQAIRKWNHERCKW